MTATMTKADIKKVEVMEMWLQRQIHGIKWMKKLQMMMFCFTAHGHK